VNGMGWLKKNKFEALATLIINCTLIYNLLQHNIKMITFIIGMLISSLAFAGLEVVKNTRENKKQNRS
jgi:hypothetical protein